MRVTPCCKTRKWHPIFRHGLPNSGFDNDLIRCELCDKEIAQELMEEVVNGYNPLTFFCDKCHASMEDEVNKSKQDNQ